MWDNCGGADVRQAFQVPREQRVRDKLKAARGERLEGTCTAIPGCQQVWLRQL